MTHSLNKDTDQAFRSNAPRRMRRELLKAVLIFIRGEELIQGLPLRSLSSLGSQGSDLARSVGDKLGIKGILYCWGNPKGKLGPCVRAIPSRKNLGHGAMVHIVLKMWAPSTCPFSSRYPSLVLLNGKPSGKPKTLWGVAQTCCLSLKWSSQKVFRVRTREVNHGCGSKLNQQEVDRRFWPPTRAILGLPYF